MRKIIIFIFIVLTFICSCSEKKETAKANEYLSNAGDYNKRGENYYNQHQYQRALEDFNKAISLKQDDALYYSNRGATYFNLRQYKQAIEDLNKAIGLQPDFAKAYTNRAAYYLLQGNKIPGCADAKKACELKKCEALEFAKGKGWCG